MENKIKKFFEINKIKFEGEIDTQILQKFIKSYRKWNAINRFSAIENEREIFFKHLLDSFSLLKIINNETLADIGSGGGFPGVALSLANKNFHLISIEKNRKKINFQKSIIAELNLKNIEFYEGDFNNFKVDKKIDYFVFRALDEKEKIIDKLKKDKIPVIYMAGSTIPEILQKEFSIEKVFEYELPESKILRKLVILK